MLLLAGYSRMPKRYGHLEYRLNGAGFKLVGDVDTLNIYDEGNAYPKIARAIKKFLKEEGVLVEGVEI